MANFWCRAASAALCVALSTNMMEVSAIDTSQDLFESSDMGGGNRKQIILPHLQPSRNQTKQNRANIISMMRTAAIPRTRTTPDAALSAPSAPWKSRLTLFSN